MASPSPVANSRPNSAANNKSVRLVKNKYLDKSISATADAQYFDQIKNAKKDYKSPYKRNLKSEREYLTSKSQINKIIKT